MIADLGNGGYWFIKSMFAVLFVQLYNEHHSLNQFPWTFSISISISIQQYYDRKTNADNTIQLYIYAIQLEKCLELDLIGKSVQIAAHFN